MAKGDKKPVVMTGDIDSTVAKKLHAPQHAAGGSDPITPGMIGAAVNDNLLDNWYFLNPVNQRGETTYSGKVSAIDVWRSPSNNCIAQLTEYGLRVRPASGTNTYFNQWLEFPEQYFGKEVTLSVLVASTVTNDDGTITANEFNLYTVTGKLLDAFPESAKPVLAIDYMAQISMNTTSLFVQLSPTSDRIYAAVKLEFGDTQTLAHQDESGNWVLNEIPDYGEELIKCQRYYQLFTSADKRPTDKRDFRPEMRISPATGTITIDGVTYYYADANL